MKKHLSEEELLKMAATWQVAKVGRHREDDGTVPGWHTWSQSHSQKEDEIVICRGREEWQRTNPETKEQQHLNVSLVSWNILSDTWWQWGKQQGNYDHTPQEEGEWSFRLRVMLTWIERLNPDVLALQEVDYDKFAIDILPELDRMGYCGSMQKPKKKAETQPCGVATFWKNEKFGMEKETSFSRTQCVILQNRQTNNDPQYCSQVCITNVHLESSQSELGSDRRARQLNSALAFAAAEAPNAALLVCGDCNTGADAQLFRVLREHQWHGHSLSSVYEHPSTHRTLPVSVATFMVPGHHYVIDHMLYDQDTLRLKCALDAFSKEEMEEHVHAKGDQCGFPSAFCPSDHIPIGAVFELLPQAATLPQRQQQTAMISEERKSELVAQWASLQAQRPPHRKGKPTPEELVERKAYASAVKAWKETVQGNTRELDFVVQLIKGK